MFEKAKSPVVFLREQNMFVLLWVDVCLYTPEYNHDSKKKMCF